MRLFQHLVNAYFQPKMLAILCLGFASGLPLALTSSTLTIWFAESHVDKTTIGLFAAVATPYALKFLWAPVVDGIKLPFFSTLGRRTSWLITIELGLMVAIFTLGLANPEVDPWMTALAAFVVAFFSASQDIVIDAYRVELLPAEQQGEGAAMVVLGYRFGMVTSTAGALFLAASYGWMMTYALMALLPLVGIAAVMFAGEPKVVASCLLPVASKKNTSSEQQATSHWIKDNIIAPFADFMTRPQWLTILLFILLYKFADSFIGIMTNPFLIELGFKKEEIASIVKLYGLVATIIGGFIGGTMVHKLGMMKSLWVCGIAHGLTNLMFFVQAKVGYDTGLLAFSITLENITGGMGTAAFVAYVSSLTNVQFTATQYALLSSFASFGRAWLSTPAGYVAEKLGWEMFFVISAFLAIPGLALLWWMEKDRRIKTPF